MAIQLKKGSSISLKKQAPGLDKVMLGLGWDMADSSKRGLFSFLKSTPAADLDSSVFCLNAQGKLDSNEDVVYYSNLTHRSGSIRHQGDNLTGKGDGDDEQIMVDLQRVPADISVLLFTVNIYMARERKQDFSSISNAFVRLVDMSTNREIAYYKLSGSAYQDQTIMLMAELRREGSSWQMKALGEGSTCTLMNLIKAYR